MPLVEAIHLQTSPVEGCLSGSIERGLRERFPGIQIVSLDIDPRNAATRVCDIREFGKAEMFEYPPATST